MRLVEKIRGSIWDKYRMLPQSLRLAALARQRAPIWRHAGIVFIHIPKAAGTSMNIALYGQTMGHPRARDVKRWAPSDVQALPTFAITRNPWDRLLSAYRFAKLGRGVGGKFEAGVWRPERYRIPAFDTFDRFVMDWLCRNDVRRLDPIFQPQTGFVCDHSGKMLVDHVGRLENLGPTLDFIQQHFGTVQEVPHGNRSGERIEYRSFYTPALAQVVRTIYADDVEAFAYEF